jgi:ferredoxin
VIAVRWTIRLDATACARSGVCGGTRPDTFRTDSTGSRVVRDTAEPDDELLDVAFVCPAQAIVITDEGGRQLAP